MAYRFFTFFLLIVLLPAGAMAAPPQGPAYWIDALAAPDSVVLTPVEIDALNRSITAGVDQMADVAGLPDEVDGSQLGAWLTFEPLPTPSEPRFSADNSPLGPGFFSSLRENMALDNLSPTNPVAFGVVVERADIRAFPSGRVVIKRPGGFDTLQYSSISPGERVALLHSSADGEWGFFQTRFVRGWMRLGKVAFGVREATGGPLERSGFIVVTGSRERVYSGAGLERPVMELPMGSVLRLAEGQGDKEGRPFYTVWYPASSPAGLAWKRGFVDARADVSEGFLPYTRRNIITQAFKMLGEEYGWGGEGGRRDCSAFIMDIFATAGIHLPRNSARQVSTGAVKLKPAPDALASPSAVARALKGADPGITLLALDGHIMLYIGEAAAKPYVIHQIWGYMDAGGLNELKKVSVTGLELGGGSEAGTFRERIKSISEVTLSPSFLNQATAQGL